MDLDWISTASWHSLWHRWLHGSWMNLKTSVLLSTESLSSNPHHGTKGCIRLSPLIHVDHTPTSGASFIAHFPGHIQGTIKQGTLRIRKKASQGQARGRAAHEVIPIVEWSFWSTMI
ncbi:hypothetical protein H257_10281 [Aphanomyces astaci]|uniref:Uncharacterized protein n=1 Tax=Aphanomyces astaci TaxID=112090 RepID=W4G8Q0_APHAT|nr:hypothetical protein H257_10281 [Aphanomyces astaci]ETV75439.1 hypothetical protein H257_10281 [Aphanomyces astaci]|eukprot:XP_009835073.1 hypothetical protein H257_10281 [Aphanomyces astaci]